MKITVNPNVDKFLGLKEVKEKFVDDTIYEVSGADIKRASKGLYEAGKLKGWLYGAAAIGVAWVANSVIGYLEKEFEKAE
jgi:hypothetical protein